MADILTFQSSAFAEETAIVGFRGREATSTPYRFDVFVTVPADGSFVAADALWLRASISIDRGPDKPPYDIHGLIASVDLVLLVAERALYRVVLVPHLWQLSISRHSRVFTGESAPDIVKKVLEAAGLSGDDFELRLRGTYAPEEHVCQYKESDLDFISRWMEREGISYYFEQGERQEKLIIVDDKSAHEPLLAEPVRYYPSGSGDVSAGECFDVFTSRSAVRPSAVRLSDYDYAKPSLDVGGEADVSASGFGEVSEHGARFFTPSEGSRIAKIRAGELIASQQIFRAEGRVFHLRPGYTFELTDHPRASMNGDYLCTALEHHANLRATTKELRDLTGLHGPDVYRARAVAIRADVQLRPERRTKRPRIDGFEAAVVDGPGDSEYAQLDDAGRYAIKFHFDESDLKGGKASTRVRMMQPHAGAPEGFHLPLRKGTEVLVAFLSGDPDRPVIAGAVPNAVTPSPVTSSNHTQNVFHTGSNNRLEIEDNEGKQYIDWSTPPADTMLHLGVPHEDHTHYIVEKTKGDCLFEIGSNQDINVGGKLTEKVKGVVQETYKTSQDTEIIGPQKTTVSGPVLEVYKNTQKTEVTGLVTEKYAAPQITCVSGGLRKEVYVGGQKTKVTGPVVEVYAGTHDKKITGATSQSYIGPVITNVGGAVTQTFSGAVTQLYGPTIAMQASVAWTIPNAANILTPSWQIIGTSAKLVQTTTDALTGADNEFVDIALAYTRLKIEGTGIALARTGVKVELTTSTLAAYGMSIGLFGVKFTTESAATIKTPSFSKKGP